MSNRNSKVLTSFVLYCSEHPEERFWQALRNWCGHNFILVNSRPPLDWHYESNLSELLDDLKDTFNWEGRDG